jgi:uracil-DNA glycosylase family 4
MSEPLHNSTEKINLMTRMAEWASECTACKLSCTRNKVVFGVGNVNSPLMLVGEGPGANEDATGVPFVGRAGALLDECLREAGMLRKHVYIANIIKCRATELEGGRLKNRPPTAEEVSTCVPLWLEQQILLVQPRVILCIGSPSANAIIRKGFKIMSERGNWFQCKYTSHAMATLHPAYILRQEGEAYDIARQSLVNDLMAAKIRAKQAMGDLPSSLS